VFACLAIILAVLGSARPAVAQPDRPNPRLTPPPSRLNQPYTAPILVFGEFGLGAGLSDGQGDLETTLGGGVIFRPGASASFLDFLHAWDCGLVLQAQHQDLSATDDLLSADGLVRRYFRDRGRGRTEVRLFAGAGLGATRITEPGTGGVRAEKALSGLLEAGQEWLVDAHWCFVLRGQYRVLLQGGHHHATWQATAAVGLPFPF